MGVTLSPFRYLPLVRYAVHKWLDKPVSVIGKLKPKRKAQIAPARIVHATASAHAESSAQGAAAALSRANPSPISQLMNDPALFPHGPGGCAPENVVVLCHGTSHVCLTDYVVDVLHSGLYGFSTATPIPLFPSLKLHYWASVLEVLRDRMGVKVLVVGVKGYVCFILSVKVQLMRTTGLALSKSVVSKCTRSSKINYRMGLV